MRRIATGIVLASILLVFMVSCSSTGWLSDPYRDYSKEDYVCAIGYGKNASEADLDARKELASLFGMAVQSTATRTLMEASVATNGKTSDSFGEFFTSNASVTVSADNLYGVEIAKRATDKEGRFVSLAVMEKRTTTDYYLARLGSMDKQIESLYDSVSARFGTLAAVKDSVELVNLCNDYNTYTAMCNYLSGRPYEYRSLSSAYELYRAARDSVVLDVSVEGDDSGAVRSAVSKVFTDSGFSVSKGTLVQTASVTVSITWRETKGTGIASDFVFAEYNADVSLVDLAGNETILVISLSGKEGHQTIESAKARAVTDLVSQIDNDLREAISGTLSY